MANPGARAEPPEPQGYRADDYRAPTPATVAGGTALDTAAARQLWKDGGAVWIDVLAGPHRPENLPSAAVWLPVPHRDIPGSLWLPDIGRGALNAKLEAYFRANLEELTKGRRDAPVVFYCLANCWMSWNAAKRAAGWGYRARLLVSRRHRRVEGGGLAARGGGAGSGIPMSKAVGLAWLWVMLAIAPALGADLSAEQVHAIVAAAASDRPADLSGKSLENLDLSNFDFRRANLSGANLFGAKLVGADFSGVDLSGAKLDLAWIMRANFTDANLSRSSLLGLVVASGLDYSAAEAPTFRGANFSGAHVLARLARFDLRGADFHGAKMGADMKNQSMGLMRCDLSGSDLAGANFSKADLSLALMRFANLTGANFARRKSVRSRSFGRRPDRCRPDRRRRDRSRFRRRGADECARSRHDERLEAAAGAIVA